MTEREAMFQIHDPELDGADIYTMEEMEREHGPGWMDNPPLGPWEEGKGPATVEEEWELLVAEGLMDPMD